MITNQLILSPLHTTGRFEGEIKEDLGPLLKKIDAEVKAALSWQQMVPAMMERFARHIVNRPAGSLFKVFFFASTGYINYLLLKGVFAGVEVDVDSNFLDLFSSNSTERLNAGLDLTNGEQAGQFMLDMGLSLYAAFVFLIKRPYDRYLADILNSVYNKHLSEIAALKNDSSQDQLLYFKLKEELDLLYDDLKEKLKTYGQEPNFHQGNHS